MKGSFQCVYDKQNTIKFWRMDTNIYMDSMEKGITHLEGQIKLGLLLSLVKKNLEHTITIARVINQKPYYKYFIHA